MSNTPGLFDEYEQFVEKFKPKKTTDDCYTPPAVFEAIKSYVVNRWGIDPETIVRPFYPGGDYERFEYPKGCLVLDNPPFSILTQIAKHYTQKGIKYFLFAPHLTVFSVLAPCTKLITNSDITYENGANVKTAFIHNLEPGLEVETSYELLRAIKTANKTTTVSKPKYRYPDNVLTVSKVAKLVQRGISYTLHATESKRIPALMHQKKHGKGIFGSGYIINDAKANELAKAIEDARAKAIEDARAEAEEDASQAIYWELSEAEKLLIDKLNKEQ